MSKVHTQRRGALRAEACLEGCSQRRAHDGNGEDRTEAWRAMAEGGRPNCEVPELEAVLGKTHRTEF